MFGLASEDMIAKYKEAAKGGASKSDLWKQFNVLPTQNGHFLQLGDPDAEAGFTDNLVGSVLSGVDDLQVKKKKKAAEGTNWLDEFMSKIGQGPGDTQPGDYKGYKPMGKEQYVEDTGSGLFSALKGYFMGGK